MTDEPDLDARAAFQIVMACDVNVLEDALRP